MLTLGEASRNDDKRLSLPMPVLSSMKALQMKASLRKRSFKPGKMPRVLKLDSLHETYD